QCGTVEVYVVFLDTLTPVFELYVWLRETRQVLRPETLEVSGMDLQLCVCRFDSFEVCPGVGTVVTAVVVCGVPEWWHSFGYGWYLSCGVTFHSMCFTLPRVLRARCEAWWASHWTQSAHRFSACERDKGMRRVLNATALVVAFLLPPLSVDVCIRAKCRALGSARPGGELLRDFLTIRGPGGVLGALSPRGRCAERGKRRGISGFHVLREGGASALVTLMERIAHNCGTVEVYVVFLDTLTPVFELYVRLRERRQVLRPETLEVSGMDLQLCVCRFDSFEVCPGVGTVVTAVVVCGVPEWWHSFGYGWYLYPVWVIVCGDTSYTSLF
ncbi:hypothetical protein Taro_028616, partial [Colocasia esculenta]|nr:hypothetical protein [Colocasia esculenta]